MVRALRVLASLVSVGRFDKVIAHKVLGSAQLL
jgi:hypothetical protein